MASSRWKAVKLTAFLHTRIITMVEEGYSVRMTTSILFCAAAMAVAPLTASAADAARGAKLYATQCAACHSPDMNRSGPKHRGVVGRKAGAVVGYSYSAKLKASGIVWTPAKLDKWLAGPQALVPGSAMFVSVPDAGQRADIIAYLATLK